MFETIFKVVVQCCFVGVVVEEKGRNFQERMGNEELFPTETSNDCENQNVCEKLYDIVIIIDCYHM